MPERVLRRAGTSIGFAGCPFIPAAIAFCLSSTKAFAVHARHLNVHQNDVIWIGNGLFDLLCVYIFNTPMIIRRYFAQKLISKALLCRAVCAAFHEILHRKKPKSDSARVVKDCI